MEIEILGAESLGVRGLSCVVRTDDRTILIDPGLALGYHRHGLLPHPAQVAVGECVRSKILSTLEEASDVVLSHLHGDHIPLPDANPYQILARRAAPLCRTVRLWVKGQTGLSRPMIDRRAALGEALERRLPSADGLVDGALSFSPPVAHGEPDTYLGTVIMTRVEDKGVVFVHAPDIQLLDARAVSLLTDWAPDVALVGGPPLYLSRVMTPSRRGRAWQNALRLARSVNTLILDHHMLRCTEGLEWLERLSAETPNRVMCAADYMERSRCLLEARRETLYEEMPVPEGWHRAYARGEADTSSYRQYVSTCA